MLSAPGGYTPLDPTSSRRPCPPPGSPLSRLSGASARFGARPLPEFFGVLVFRFLAMLPPHARVLRRKLPVTFRIRYRTNGKGAPDSDPSNSRNSTIVRLHV